MRPTLTMIGMTVLLGGAMGLGFAAPAHAQPGAFTLQVQLFEIPRSFIEPPRYDDRKPIEVEPRGWERTERRADRDARDQARIEEAARREAQQIEEEREERRAFRRAQRESRGEFRPDERGEYRGDPRGDERFDELRERYRRN